MSEALDVVQRYIGAFNAGDVEAMAAAFAPDGWRIAAWAWAKGSQ